MLLAAAKPLKTEKPMREGGMGGLLPILQFLGGRSKIKSNAEGIEKKRKKMSGTVNYPKVIDHLTDVIKELNVPCAEPPAPAEPTAAERQADAAALLRGLMKELEPHGADAHAAEHSATADKRAPWRPDRHLHLSLS